MKEISLCLLLILNTGLSAQDLFDTDSLSDYGKPGFFEVEKLQIHSFELSGELYDMDIEYFEQLLEGEGVLPAIPNNAALSLWLAMMRKNSFYGLSLAFSSPDPIFDEQLNQETYLNYQSASLKYGYNMLFKDWVVVSVYTGVRMFRFRHLTSSLVVDRNISDYLLEPDIDLRVINFSGLGGVNLSFTVLEALSVGIHGEYLLQLHENPIIRSPVSRIMDRNKGPIGSWMISAGIGYRF